jgi:hypothetical protein
MEIIKLKEQQKMKHYNKYQKNIVTETKEKFKKAKQPEYRLRKWRGNTLVPVVIGLAVSGVATVAFLNQGSNLAQDNKAMLAKNELASIVSQFDTIQSSVTPKNVTSDMLPKLASTKTNVYGLSFTFTPCSDGGCEWNATPKLTYGTPNIDACEVLTLAMDNSRNPILRDTLCTSQGVLEVIFASEARS